MNGPTEGAAHGLVAGRRAARGGMRRPILGTLATFAVSGLIHEYLFDIAVGRIQGHQTAFFPVQGAAVVPTARLDPRGGWRALGIAATLAFNLATGTLFFASVDEVLPFYQRRRSMIRPSGRSRCGDEGIRS